MPSTQGDPPRPRLLLVEDDDDNRELMAEVLEGEGFEVVAARTGREALALLDGPRARVVVTDVALPGPGGLAIARAAKRAWPGVPVLVVTGFSERDDLARARGAEVDEILVKPVDPDALVAAVTSALRGGPGLGAPDAAR